MKSKLSTINSKLEAKASKKPKRIMGFKEWVENVWEPVQQAEAFRRSQRSTRPFKEPTSILE